MKVAIVGGGGFRTPLVHAALADADVSVSELVLHDVDADRLSRIEAVITALDHERGGAAMSVRTTTLLDDAVDGAGAVLAAIRVGGMAARVVDEEVPLSLGVLGQETVGPGGIAFALRTIPVMESIARAVERRAPEAWFVNFSNPAGIVTEAARGVLGERAIGICDSPAALCLGVAAGLGRPADGLRFDYGGLNHLGWLTGVDDDETDLLPGFLADDELVRGIEEGRLFGAEPIRALGAIPNEYLVYLDRSEEVVAAFARSGGRGAIVAEQQRAFYEDDLPDAESALRAWRRAKDRRDRSYLAEARDARPAEDEPDGSSVGIGELGYALVAAEFLAAIERDEARRLVLDVANHGRLAGIGDDEVVEVTCEVGSGAVRPLPGRPLPAEAADLVGRVREVERLTLRAAAEGSAAIALQAIAAHPVVPRRDAAERILAGYLEGHPGLRELVR